jgi:hypothetical protein
MPGIFSPSLLKGSDPRKTVSVRNFLITGRGPCLFIIPLLIFLAAIILLVPDIEAAAKCDVIFPLNKTSVELGTTTVFGLSCESGYMPRMTLNRGGIIPQMFPNGTFRQSMVLKRGVNILKIDRQRIFIAFDPPGKKTTRGRYSTIFLAVP